MGGIRQAGARPRDGSTLHGPPRALCAGEGWEAAPGNCWKSEAHPRLDTRAHCCKGQSGNLGKFQFQSLRKSKKAAHFAVIGRGPVGTGELLSVEQRRATAQHRFGKGKTEDDSSLS